MTLRAPFPWFGGKSYAAPTVWQALGEVKNYVEPFAGSAAVLLSAPRVHDIETINDADGFVANFWRATQADPEAVAHWADWPVNEADLEARHAWLVARSARLRWSLEDPDFFDAKVAGWWVWGQCAWIGTGWCSGEGPHKHDGAHFGGNAGRGINRQLPHLGDAGRGVNRQVYVSEWISALAARLRRVRVACGDWRRVVTPSITHNIGNFRGNGKGNTGVFLDPPYGAGSMTYAADDNSGAVARDVWEWAVTAGEHPRMRIVVAAYEDGRELPPGWTARKWMGGTGISVVNGNRAREVLYCSPACVDIEQPLLEAAQ